MLAVTAPRFARVLLGSVLLGAPFVLAAHTAAALVAPFTKATVGALVRVTAPLNAVAKPESDSEVDEVAPVVSEPAAALAFEAATKPGTHRPQKPLAKSFPTALFVSKNTVLKLANSAARPRGSFVQETPEHPAGLRLAGVGPLGIGVQDGDILVEALGITPRSPGQVIGAIIEARAKQPRFLSGSLWRQGKRIAITVEQPYMDFSQNHTSAAPTPVDSGDLTTASAPGLAGVREGSSLPSDRDLL
jgi:hypothetical protein